MKRPVPNADEKDAHSKYWRARLFWQRGELKKIKRRSIKRERRTAKKEIKEQMND